ncbi:Ctr copper transporter [Scleroderma citrinum]
MDHDMPGPMCSMHMLWNTQVIDTCIIFSSWHIHTHFQFVLSLLAIVLLGVLFEYLRVLQQCVDHRIATKVGKGKRTVSPPSVSGRSTPEGDARNDEALSLLNGRRARSAKILVPTHFRVLRAALYAASVFLSFFLMLVFMTYNAYLIFAVVAGAAIGHYVFGGYLEPDNLGKRGMACH